MAKDPQSGTLAIILHADVADSTRLVQLDEHAAHERIQDAFRRFSDTIGKYQGQVRELRGDALLAEFKLPSDAVTAALAFQSEHHDHIAKFNDNIQPRVRVGIAMGEVVIADNTVTGAGVVLAQRVEQLADPGGLCITAAIHEALPKRMPFDLENLGEQTLKGFDDLVRVYRVELKPDQSIPLPQEIRQSETSPKTRKLIIALTAVILVVTVGAAYWFKPWQPEEKAWTTQFSVDSGDRGWSRIGVKMGYINLQLKIPSRWDTQVIEEKDLNLQGFVTSKEQVGWETMRLLDGTINSQVLVATDQEGVAHFRVFKLYKHLPSATPEQVSKFFQNRGVQMILDRYMGTTDYNEIREALKVGTLGSGEKMTMVPSVLRINEEKRYVWTVFTLRPN
ncbi:MAG: adenylate/guanylate cyclase domain-containing protein, partial [Gammaproteobacteria bacterium]